VEEVLFPIHTACADHRQEVQDPVADSGFQFQGSELGVDLGGKNSVEC
jgi:hypothetical protein